MKLEKISTFNYAEEVELGKNLDFWLGVYLPIVTRMIFRFENISREVDFVFSVIFIVWKFTYPV